MRLSFHVHTLVCRYNLPLAKPLTLSLPLTPNEVRLVGRTNIIYEIAGCTGRGKRECYSCFWAHTSDGLELGGALVVFSF